MSYVVNQGIMLYKMNVKSAFINGVIFEDVYVKQQTGFEDLKHPEYAFKLKKSLYDTFLVGEKSSANISALKVVLILFEVSGLMVNFHKSMLLGINIFYSWLHEVDFVLNCKHSRVSFLYFGLPICGDPRKFRFWYRLLDRIKKRLSGWKSRNLSKVGYLILLKFMLSYVGVLSSSRPPHVSFLPLNLFLMFFFFFLRGVRILGKYRGLHGILCEGQVDRRWVMGILLYFG